MLYIVFTKSWLNPASNICDVSCSEKKREKNETAPTSFIGEYVGGAWRFSTPGCCGSRSTTPCWRSSRRSDKHKRSVKFTTKTESEFGRVLAVCRCISWINSRKKHVPERVDVWDVQLLVLTMITATTRAAIPIRWILSENKSLILLWQLCNRKTPLFKKKSI